MDCDFILTDIPRISDYFFTINAGMNLRCIRDSGDEYSYFYNRIYNDTISDEGFEYSIPDNTGQAKVIRDAFRFRYVGKFPVIVDTFLPAHTDWKGNIAFNGHAVRADGKQCAWYPVLYDVQKKKKYQQVRYDLEVACSDCNTIYLNGLDPVKAKKAHFHSDVPVELMLFAGDYKSAKVNNTYFLNADISTEQMDSFSSMTDSFRKFYERNLGIPYKFDITYIQTTPVSTSNAWLFVCYPTIVNVGWGEYGMKSFFDPTRAATFKPFIAHELGHYYFGTYRAFNSTLGDMMSEGFSEYLSMLAVRQFFADTVYKEKINDKLERLDGYEPTPIAKLKNKLDYGNRELYVYNYAPMIFTAIEKEIGTKAMWKWLRVILTTNSMFTDYAFLQQTLQTSLDDTPKFKILSQKYFESNESLKNVITSLGRN